MIKIEFYLFINLTFLMVLLLMDRSFFSLFFIYFFIPTNNMLALINI